MEKLEFSQIMERSILSTLQPLSSQCSPVAGKILAYFIRFETQLAAFIDEVALNPKVYPDIDADKLLADTEWKSVTAEFTGKFDGDLRDLAVIWTVYSLQENSSQYYQQAALHSYELQQKIFYKSLAELKTIIKRRADAANRISYNLIWDKVGFAPFQLGKE